MRWPWTRIAVLALTAVAMSDGIRVAFCDGSATTGVTYPGSETLVIEVLSDSRLRMEYVSTASLDTSQQIEIDAAAIDDDPFAGVREVIEELQAKVKKATD